MLGSELINVSKGVPCDFRHSSLIYIIFSLFLSISRTRRLFLLDNIQIYGSYIDVIVLSTAPQQNRDSATAVVASNWYVAWLEQWYRYICLCRQSQQNPCVSYLSFYSDDYSFSTIDSTIYRLVFILQQLRISTYPCYVTSVVLLYKNNHCFLFLRKSYHLSVQPSVMIGCQSEKMLV